MTRESEDDAMEALDAAVRHETTEAVETTARRVAERTTQRWWPHVMLTVAGLSVLISSAVAVGYGELSSRVIRAEAEVSDLRRMAEEARTAGERANAELQRRGQPPVPIPTPGRAQDSEVLVAAAAARVLSELPDRSPSKEQLAAAIIETAATNPNLFAPSPQQIAAAVGAYFVVNPPPPGPSGQPGRPGADGVDGVDGKDGTDGRDGADAPPPTPEQLQAAVADHLRANPDALCPLGGRFAQLTVRLADGGTADTWTCVVQVSAPAPTSTAPAPTPTLQPLGR